MLISVQWTAPSRDHGLHVQRPGHAGPPRLPVQERQRQEASLLLPGDRHSLLERPPKKGDLIVRYLLLNYDQRLRLFLIVVMLQIKLLSGHQYLYFKVTFTLNFVLCMYD